MTDYEDVSFFLYVPFTIPRDNPSSEGDKAKCQDGVTLFQGNANSPSAS
jgi:hypothetical protein